ncbi:hypothetical protein BCR44DRAFT_125312 [Catenaria anguillulae PL171]|uniref:Sphingomyelin synthase-like domain-containing protein n=1 Tax=Catenaria anguillulae PL171 TaxID=765915 RepID=A0A1Y2I0Q3_9FUNG|nr:hypothetical protein BCR44DRAFT_125312 [Catenaria anguillulae PL171]
MTAASPAAVPTPAPPLGAQTASQPSQPTQSYSQPPLHVPLKSSIGGTTPPAASLSARAWAWVQPYLTLWRSTWDLKITVYAILWFVVCTYIVCLSNSAVDRINPNNFLPFDERKVLHDPLLKWSFQVFVQSGLPQDLSDLWVRAATALLFARALTMKRRSLTILRRILYISGAVYLMRAPSVILTVLPNPYIQCISNPHPNIFIDAIDLMLQRRYSCGDVFFSGHSIFITLVARIYIMYTDNVVIHLLACLFTAGGLFSLVFTTYHYSIDVLFAFTIVTALYSIYHWIAKGKMGVNRWWGKVILYIDGERIMDQEEEELLPMSRRGSAVGSALDDSDNNGQQRVAASEVPDTFGTPRAGNMRQVGGNGAGTGSQLPVDGRSSLHLEQSAALMVPLPGSPALAEAALLDDQTLTGSAAGSNGSSRRRAASPVRRKTDASDDEL